MYEALWGYSIPCSVLYGNSLTSRPLTDLLKTDDQFNRGATLALAFVRLIPALTTSPILAQFYPTAATEFRTEAGGHGIGANLPKRQDGRKHINQQYSHLVISAEQKYRITDRESLALVWL